MNNGWLMQCLLVGCGGFIGAAARHGVGAWAGTLAAQPRFPWATFAVNVSGCLLVGVLAGWAERHAFGGHARLFLVVGVLGGYTTFSAFGLETLLMLRRGDAWLAAGYVFASVLLGLVAVWLGLRMAGALPGRA